MSEYQSHLAASTAEAVASQLTHDAINAGTPLAAVQLHYPGGTDPKVEVHITTEFGATYWPVHALVASIARDDADWTVSRQVFDGGDAFAVYAKWVDYRSAPHVDVEVMVWAVASVKAEPGREVLDASRCAQCDDRVARADGSPVDVRCANCPAPKHAGLVTPKPAGQ